MCLDELQGLLSREAGRANVRLSLIIYSSTVMHRLRCCTIYNDRVEYAQSIAEMLSKPHEGAWPSSWVESVAVSHTIETVPGIGHQLDSVISRGGRGRGACWPG